VLATKFFMPFDDDPNHRGGSRRWIMQEVENSLRRLGTDHIDRYQMHRWASSTAPIIGPRTMEHLQAQLAAADVVLPGDVLDRIDQIVPPCVTLNPADNGWVSPSLRPSARRR
jgi:aryl-alcohol dehydrogenase-like predicted oxidoreductase